jgi:hypothetical protein
MEIQGAPANSLPPRRVELRRTSCKLTTELKGWFMTLQSPPTREEVVAQARKMMQP